VHVDREPAAGRVVDVVVVVGSVIVIVIVIVISDLVRLDVVGNSGDMG
jgi:hypothetical protein